MAIDQDIRDEGIVSSLRERGITVPSSSILLPTVGIVISELFLFFGYTRYALIGHLGTLLLCVLAPLRLDDDIAMFQVFALIPVFRLVNLGMPVFFELTVYWFPLIYGPLIPAIYVVGQANNAVNLTAGWKTALIGLPLAIPAAAIMGGIEYQILAPEALVPRWSLLQLAVITVVMIAFIGLVEELLYRGVLQGALVDRIGTWPGIVLASSIFGLMHAGYHIPEELLFAGSIGFIFGVIYHRTNSLALITIMHGLLNVFLFAVIPLNGPLPELISTL